MIIFERRQRLMTILREQPGIRVPEVAELLGVSEGTIRNDLNSLAGSGQVRRVRGGGVLLDEQQDRRPIFATRVMTHRTAKQSIGQQAARLVSDNDSVMLDSSTTSYYLACCLKERRDLTVITNGIESARELAKDPSNTVILLGGVLRTDGTATSVPMGEQFLGDYHIKTAFVSCSGFTPEGGLVEVDIYEAQIKRKVIASSGSTVALIDATKFGRMDLTVFARANQITHLFTDRGLSPEWVEKLKQAGVPFTVCGARTEPP
ncbi:MAG: DeoR/GlpR family DNA-binding transcription regulator [Anaerolineales bacterium]|jgi:DeoR/GlpR family transcriptional regulator of sugar metabolism